MATCEILGDATRGGAWAAVRLRVDGERIVAADAEGLERPLAGLTLLEAARVGGDPLAVEALAAALGPIFRAAPERGRIAVAMSGGVDSAVALLRAGPKAVGVTLRLWQDPAGPSAERACCSPEAVAAARATCHALGLPHVTLDLRGQFRASVVDPFVSGYARGETPNPCARCNGAFRFDALLAFARRAGAEELWTGHYARIVERGGVRLLGRAADPEKDQSYMLAPLDPALLARIRFPLGEQTKQETRAEAARAGLAAATRAESQEACFLAGGDYRAFLERSGLPARPGEIVDEEGRLLGRHGGYWRFTPGQRRGLGLAAARPLYVLRTEPAANRVVVGPREALAARRVEAEGRLYAPVRRAQAKLRYRSDPVPTRVRAGEGGFALELEEPAYAVAPGQLAALYDGDAVVGAGVIRAAS
ncbi:MAG TPA: tRNA 2-thiouridine(34) synthase MnmA [Gaiellaceae bacterium]|nr:tRNA 2-thiouridine(34) synthase MnmA [Gaiellaceae bacterium]